MPAEDKKVEEVPPEEVVNEGEQKKEEKVEEVVEVEMALDEFYPEGHQEKKFADSDLSKRTVQFFGCYGQTSYKRYNFHWLGDEKFIFVTGNTY